MHGCDGRDPAPGRRGREARAGVAVPARAERRPRDEDVGLDLGQHLEQGRERLVLVLGEVVVAARERRHDLHAVERRGQPSPGPDRAVEPSRRSLGLLLPAHAGEELVQVVDGLHSVLALRASCPIWLAAPR